MSIWKVFRTSLPCPDSRCPGTLEEWGPGKSCLWCPICKREEPLPPDRWMKRQNAERLFQ